MAFIYGQGAVLRRGTATICIFHNTQILHVSFRPTKDRNILEQPKIQWFYNFICVLMPSVNKSNRLQVASSARKAARISSTSLP